MVFAAKIYCESLTTQCRNAFMTGLLMSAVTLQFLKMLGKSVSLDVVLTMLAFFIVWMVALF